MANDINIAGVVDGIAQARGHYSPGNVACVYRAIEILRGLPYAPAYLDGVRDELLGFLTTKAAAPRYYTASVYLAFYGVGDRATYLKVGIAKDVEARMSGHTTSNPLPNLWTYTAGFDRRAKASAVELALLRHLSGDKVHGEWVHVHGLSEQAARSFVESLAEVASSAHGSPVFFNRGR